MTLPAITLPKVELPFDISVLLHPPVVHLMIALPIIILLLELLNLMFKKKAIGGISFFLIFLTVLVAAAAYLTGLVDGKEAYPALSDAAKTALSEHKLLGTYLLLAPVVVLFFKLLSAVTKNGFMKFLYLLVLIAFVAGIFKQGQEGGELVYEYGMNVEKVQVLEEDIFDLKEEITELTSKPKETVSTPTVVPVVQKKEVKPRPQVTVETVVTPKVEEIPAVKVTPEVATEPVQVENPSAPVTTLRTEVKEKDVIPTAMEKRMEASAVKIVTEELAQPQTPVQ